MESPTFFAPVRGSLSIQISDSRLRKGNLFFLLPRCDRSINRRTSFLPLNAPTAETRQDDPPTANWGRTVLSHDPTLLYRWLYSASLFGNHGSEAFPLVEGRLTALCDLLARSKGRVSHLLLLAPYPSKAPPRLLFPVNSFCDSSPLSSPWDERVDIYGVAKCGGWAEAKAN